MTLTANLISQLEFVEYPSPLDDSEFNEFIDENGTGGIQLITMGSGVLCAKSDLKDVTSLVNEAAEHGA